MEVEKIREMVCGLLAGEVVVDKRGGMGAAVHGGKHPLGLGGEQARQVPLGRGPPLARGDGDGKEKISVDTVAVSIVSSKKDGKNDAYRRGGTKQSEAEGMRWMRELLGRVAREKT
uniref:Uncharacterized protein n=1 Tax=Leersia perrieri TaxID=77586 RepID=A0A0D9W1Z7_9ORYZ